MGATSQDGYRDPNNPNPGDENYKLPAGMKANPLSISDYNAEVDSRNYMQKQDISSLDKKDFLDTINRGNATNLDFGFGESSAHNALGAANAELGNAINNPNAPKYRYRKYLDTITNLQNDQPGQLQTVLSRGTNGGSLGFNAGSALGGGSL